MSNSYIISIDFGGTKILAALLNSRGQILSRFKIATQPESSKLIVVKTLVKLIKDILAESVRAICMGIPGSVNPFTGIIGSAPNLKISNFDIRTAMEKYLSIPVLVENDVNLGALGIQHFELKGKGRNFLVVFIGTGIGSALFFDGRLYRGSNYYAGEIGHIVIEPDGPLCGCGKRGHLEAVASGTAIAHWVEQELAQGVISRLPANQRLSAKQISSAAQQGDELSIAALARAGVFIGQALADFVHIFNPSIIIIGGGVSQSGNLILDPMRAGLREHVITPKYLENLILTTNALGDKAGLMGALALARELSD